MLLEALEEKNPPAEAGGGAGVKEVGVADSIGRGVVDLLDKAVEEGKVLPIEQG